MIGVRSLPGYQEALKIRQGHRLYLGPQSIEGESMDASQQSAAAPFEHRSARMEFPAQYKSLRFERQQRPINFALGQLKEIHQGFCGNGTHHFHPSAHQLAHCVFPLPMAVQLRFWRMQQWFDSQQDKPRPPSASAPQRSKTNGNSTHRRAFQRQAPSIMKPLPGNI